MSILAFSDMTPVIAGQRWYLKGVGPATIIKVLGYGAEFDQPAGKGLNVQYRTAHDRIGYCTKGDIRSTGTLLPYDKVQAQRDMEKPNNRPDVEELLVIMRRKRIELAHEWTPYKPPRVKMCNDVTILSDQEFQDDREETVVEAEIIYPKQFQKQ
jgi:hypothetical protein